MSFDDITAKEKLTTVCPMDGQRSEMFIRPSGRSGEHPQYMISLETETGSQNIGFAYFFISKVHARSSFIGMQIEPAFRGRNYANLLISSYIDLCDSSDVQNLVTHPKQRKPEIVHMLKNFGYEPNGVTPSSANMVVTLVQNEGTDSICSLYIPNEKLRSRLEPSRLARNNSYHFVSSLDGKDVVDEIYFGLQYSLSDRDKCLRKQQQVRERFQVTK